MEEMLPYQIWLKLPLDVRAKLAQVFGIAKTGQSVVDYRASGNVVTQDGYAPDDLRALTLDKLQEKLITDETDFFALVETAIDNIDDLIAGTYAPAIVVNNPGPTGTGDTAVPSGGPGPVGTTTVEHKVAATRKKKKSAQAKKKAAKK